MAGIEKHYTTMVEGQEVIPMKVIRQDGTIETRIVPVEAFGIVMRKRDGEKLTNYFTKPPKKETKEEKT